MFWPLWLSLSLLGHAKLVSPLPVTELVLTLRSSLCPPSVSHLFINYKTLGQYIHSEDLNWIHRDLKKRHTVLFSSSFLYLDYLLWCLTCRQWLIIIYWGSKMTRSLPSRRHSRTLPNTSAMLTFVFLLSDLTFCIYNVLPTLNNWEVIILSFQKYIIMKYLSKALQTGSS